MTISVQNPINEYLGNGSAKTFNYTFYITTAADLKVYLNGVLQGSGFTVTGADNQAGGTVVFTVAPTSGTRVRLQRRIELERSTDYQEAAAIPTATLDRDFDRLWMAAQDTRIGTLTLDLANTWDAGSYRVVNVGDPVNAQDAVTKHWVETALTSPVAQAAASAAAAYTSEVNAAASASAATASASTATTQAGIATAKASDAATSATGAANSEASANNSAVSAANSAATIVGIVGDAQAYANAAALSAADANTSKNNAAGSAGDAAASAAAALVSKNSASASATSASNSAAAASTSEASSQAILDEMESLIDSGSFVTSVNGRGGNVVLGKSDVGLANADNTSDLNKPISTATQAALDLKLSASAVGVTVASLVGGVVPASQLPSYVDDVIEAANFAALPATGEAGKIYITLDDNKIWRWGGSVYVDITPSGGGAVDSVNGQTGVVVLTKGDVGLSNVNNTADTAKPVSSAQQAALDLKANISSLGTVAALSYPGGTTLFLRADGTWATPAGGGTWGSITGTLSSQTDLNSALNLKAPLASPSFTGTVSGITKSMVGLSLVDNTSDANKPVSTATQTALNLKANAATPTFTGTVNVNGTTDAHLVINKTASGYAANIWGGTNGSDRWRIILGNTTAESGSNAGSNFYICRYTDGGAYIGDVMEMLRSSGQTTFYGSVRTSPISITYGATTTINSAQSNVFYVGALTGNITTLTINNPTDGQTINIRFVQDATGGRTITLPSSIKAAGVLETAASRATWLVLTYVSSASRWEGAYSGVPA